MLEISSHALERSSQRMGLTVSQAQELLKTENTVALNKPENHPERTGFRLFFNETDDKFYVGVYAFEIGDNHFKCTVLKTVLLLEWFEKDKWPVTENKKFSAVSRILGSRPIEFRACLARLSIVENRRRKFTVMAPTRKIFEIRLRASVCKEFYEKESISDICKHPAVLTILHAECRQFGFSLDKRLWIRVSDGYVTDGVLSVNKISSVPCPYCGAQPLVTDIPIPEKLLRPKFSSETSTKPTPAG